LYQFFTSFTFISIALFLCAFVFVYVILPKIRALARVSNFTSEPSKRSSHNETVPNIGGLSFFVSIMVFYFFIHEYDFQCIFPSLIPGLTILFIIGVKDDLVMVNPSTKIVAQILASTFFVFHHSFNLINFRGFLWIFELNHFFGVFLSIFITVAIINAFNLLDGIDGLAAIIAKLIFLFFFVFFFKLNFYFLAFLNVVLLGTLLAFFRFNISEKHKIFMGDTGSMIIGFMISIMTIFALSMKSEVIEHLNFPPQNLPFLLFAVLFMPIFDTARVIVLRLLQKKSPFQPDRQHIHHVLLDYMKVSHVKISLLLAFVNLLIIAVFTYFLNKIDQTIFFTIVILILTTFSYTLHKMSQKIRENEITIG
jgi:UDP-GlcNAc:undecaprenyl-phosphate GlcNAc-1-phosphate transferase